MPAAASTKEDIRKETTERFGYDLSRSLDEIRPAIISMRPARRPSRRRSLPSWSLQDFEDAIRKAISLGGDADTLAAITGSIAEAFYGGVPEEIVKEVQERVPEELWDVVKRFSQKYAGHSG